MRIYSLAALCTLSTKTFKQGKVISAMPERKHSFLKEVPPNKYLNTKLSFNDKSNLH